MFLTDYFKFDLLPASIMALAIGMFVYSTVMYGLIFWLAGTTKSLLPICITVFVVAWIGQFIGHHIEDKRPSF